GERSRPVVGRALVVGDEMDDALEGVEFDVHTAIRLVGTTLVIGELAIRVMEFTSRALHVPGEILVDQAAEPFIAKGLPSGRRTVHDPIVRKVDARGIADAAIYADRRSERTRRAVVDVWPGAGEGMDAMPALAAGILASRRRARRLPIATVDVATAPASLRAMAVGEVEVPFVGVLEAEAEREWIGGAPGPGEDRVAGPPSWTIGVVAAGPAIRAALSSRNGNALPRAVRIAFARRAVPRAEPH